MIGVSGEGYTRYEHTRPHILLCTELKCSFHCSFSVVPVPSLYVCFQLRPFVVLRKINALNLPLDETGECALDSGLAFPHHAAQQRAYSRPFLCVVKDKSRCRSAGEGAGQWEESL